MYISGECIRDTLSTRYMYIELAYKQKVSLETKSIQLSINERYQ